MYNYKLVRAGTGNQWILFRFPNFYCPVSSISNLEVNNSPCVKCLEELAHQSCFKKKKKSYILIEIIFFLTKHMFVFLTNNTVCISILCWLVKHMKIYERNIILE